MRLTFTLAVAFELIVTQWDVNLHMALINDLKRRELIVTQWDVNVKKTTRKKANSGINSYIVGCK